MKFLVYCKNSQSNSKALEAAVEMAKAFNAEVMLVWCITEQTGVPEEIVEKAHTSLQEHIDTYFTPKGITTSSKVITTTNSIGEEIVRLATQENMDAIIMGIQKRSKVGKLFFGSATQYIILESPCKVITVK